MTGSCWTAAMLLITMTRLLFLLGTSFVGFWELLWGFEVFLF